jgi:CDP-glucose 4,6-dehydratase
MGTAHLLDALTFCEFTKATLVVTTDKVYRNDNLGEKFSESDALGGADPYSASKVGTELAVDAWRAVALLRNKMPIATARAGNVIGGGDFAKDRLLPDLMRSFSENSAPILRSPYSTRPWQHVLEAIYGYITLAINLNKNKNLHGQAFNFGPAKNQNYKVISVIKLMKRYWQNVSWKLYKNNNKIFKESSLLKLNSQKAKKNLKWRSVLTFKENISLVTNWYKNFYLNSKQAYKLTSDQIEIYQKILNKRVAK